jgi:hypothetical protein
MVAEAGLAGQRHEARKVVATSGWRKEIPPPWVLALIATLILVALGTAGTAEAQEPTGQFTWPPSEPKLLWFSKRGLDLYSNKLDVSISSGVPCPQYRRIWPGDCPTEFFLTQFLKSLPPDLSVIADTLRSFGAVCRKRGRWLSCIYKKHENYKERWTNDRFNEGVWYCTAKINIIDRNTKLTYSVSFDRKRVTLYRNKPAERDAGVRGKFEPPTHTNDREWRRLRLSAQLWNARPLTGP